MAIKKKIWCGQSRVLFTICTLRATKAHEVFYFLYKSDMCLWFRSLYPFTQSLLLSPYLQTNTIMSAEATPLPQRLTQPQPLTFTLPDNTATLSCSGVQHIHQLMKPVCRGVFIKSFWLRCQSGLVTNCWLGCIIFSPRVTKLKGTGWLSRVVFYQQDTSKNLMLLKLTAKCI